jgi:hypothetical protein
MYLSWKEFVRGEKLIEVEKLQRVRDFRIRGTNKK